jgi:peptidoglycan hydrolase CwlO-like protein
MENQIGNLQDEVEDLKNKIYDIKQQRDIMIDEIEKRDDIIDMLQEYVWELQMKLKTT